MQFALVMYRHSNGLQYFQLEFPSLFENDSLSPIDKILKAMEAIVKKREGKGRRKKRKGKKEKEKGKEKEKKPQFRL